VGHGQALERANRAASVSERCTRRAHALRLCTRRWRGTPGVDLNRGYAMPRHMKVRELMSTDLVTLTEDDTLAHAQACMARGRIRHLPVVQG